LPASESSVSCRFSSVTLVNAGNFAILCVGVNATRLKDKKKEWRVKKESGITSDKIYFSNSI
jgi:hypothetical protein